MAAQSRFCEIYCTKIIFGNFVRENFIEFNSSSALISKNYIKLAANNYLNAHNLESLTKPRKTRIVFEIKSKTQPAEY